MKMVISLFWLLFCSTNVQAWSNFVENPYTPYPPGCVTLPDLQAALYGDHAVKVFEGQIEQFNAAVPESGTMIAIDLSVYRVACADHNRSIVMVELSIPAWLRSMGASIWVPGVSVYHGEDSSSYVDMRLNREPNSWDDGRYPGFNEILGGRDDDMMDGNDGPWLFVLDNYSSENLQSSVMSPKDYNDDLVIAFPGGMNPYLVTVPSTDSLFSASASMPLSGRLSGTWIDEGASDQGFVLTVSEMVPNIIPEPSGLLESPLLMFFSWYTFDVDGSMLWLAGNAEFQIGATSVTVPLVRVTNGEFMGSKAAEREVVGSAIITGVNCNDLAFDYTLNDLGLGSGTSHLQRIYSLETAGFACRDLEARMETAQ